MFFDPGRPAPQTMRDARVAPAMGKTKAPTTKDFRGSIAWLSGWLSTYHGVGFPSATQDSLPAAGQALPDGLFTRRVPPKGFQVSLPYILSSFPKLLHKPILCALPTRGRRGRGGKVIGGARPVVAGGRSPAQGSHRFLYVRHIRAYGSSGHGFATYVHELDNPRRGGAHNTRASSRRKRSQVSSHWRLRRLQPLPPTAPAPLAVCSATHVRCWVSCRPCTVHAPFDSASRAARAREGADSSGTIGRHAHLPPGSSCFPCCCLITTPETHAGSARSLRIQGLVDLTSATSRSPEAEVQLEAVPPLRVERPQRRGAEEAPRPAHGVGSTRGAL